MPGSAHNELWPELPYDAWKDTRETLHLWTQIAGKIRLGVEIPAIISQELFDRVRRRREANRTYYRNPKQVQLLSTLVRCGSCGGSVYA